MLWRYSINHFVILSGIWFCNSYDIFDTYVIFGRDCRIVVVGYFWNGNCNGKRAVVFPLKQEIGDLNRFMRIDPVSRMDKLIFKNESIVKDFFNYRRFSGVMKEEETIPEVIQDCCKYFSFTLHRNENISGKPSSKIAYNILFATHKPIVLLYVKFVAIKNFL